MIIPLASIRVRFGRRIPDRVHLLRILYLLLAACCLPPAWACATQHYEARFDADLKTMSVRACLAGTRAHVNFVADSAAATRFLSNVRRDSERAGLRASTHGWSARDWRAGACLANMQRDHTFLRVYWAGAAYWLAVDRDLRRSSGGKYSLDLALSRFSQCCLPAYRQWQPQD